MLGAATKNLRAQNIFLDAPGYRALVKQQPCCCSLAATSLTADRSRSTIHKLEKGIKNIVFLHLQLIVPKDDREGGEGRQW